MTLKDFLENFEDIRYFSKLSVYSTDYIAKHLEELRTCDYNECKFLMNEIQSYCTFPATEFNESTLEVYVFVKP